jgi:hypothetical protein
MNSEFTLSESQSGGGSMHIGEVQSNPGGDPQKLDVIAYRMEFCISCGEGGDHCMSSLGGLVGDCGERT